MSENTPMKIPTASELFNESDNLEIAFKHEKLNALLSTDPKPEWIKRHPHIPNYQYLPIDKIEYLLRKIFKKYKIEIIREGVAFNGVYVVVKVWYFNPVSGEMDYHDGIGACQLQTRSGYSAADLANLSQGAISMAFPIAKTIAIKDACDHFGNIFGCNLNRKDLVPFKVDEKLAKVDPKKARIQAMLDNCTTLVALDKMQEMNPDIDISLFEKRRETLKNESK